MLSDCVFSEIEDGGLPLFTAIQISPRAETSHVIATKFQPGGRAEISVRAETRHVIGPLAVPSPGDHKNVAGLASFMTSRENQQHDISGR